MQVGIDPKPVGAFIEYTLKPILDQLREVLELLEKKGLPAKEITKFSVKIYLITTITGFLRDILVTGLICVTAYHILLNSHLTIH